MALLIAIILWLLLVMLVLVCLALITPVFIRVHLTTSPQLAYHIDLRTLAGLGPRLTLVRAPRKGTVTKSNANPEKPKQRRMSWPKRGHGSVTRAVPPLIKGILRRIHLVELRVEADYGLGDPADTGRLCGLLMPLHYACPVPASVSLDLRPDFTRPCLEGNVMAVVRVTVAALFVPFSQFAWRVYGRKR